MYQINGSRYRNAGGHRTKGAALGAASNFVDVSEEEEEEERDRDQVGRQRRK